MEPVRFAREGSSKALGCLVYLCLGLILGTILAGLGAAITIAAAKSAKLPESIQAAVGIAASLALFTFVAWFSWRDYRRRAHAEVVVHDDGLVVNGAELAFADVESVFLCFESWSPTIELVAGDGRRRRLPADIAPFERVEPELARRFLPGMLERLEKELASGRPVPLRESAARSVGRIFYGLFLLLILGPLMIVSIRLMSRGFEAVRLGVGRIRQGWRGRGGGFTLTADGVLPPGEEARALPWRELTVEALDGHGVVLASLEGARVSASMFAGNFWPLSRVIAARLK